MFEWIIAGADRWIIHQIIGGPTDGMRTLTAQRGLQVMSGAFPQGDTDGGMLLISTATSATLEEATSAFYENLTAAAKVGATVEAQWTDGRVQA